MGIGKTGMKMEYGHIALVTYGRDFSLCYSSLKRNVSEKYGIVLRNVSAAEYQQ